MRKIFTAAVIAALALAGEAAAREVAIDYTIRGKGISAGEFAFSANFGEGRYRAEATRRATGAVRLAVGSSQDYTYRASGALTPQGPRPQDYTHRGGRRDRVVSVSFAADGSSETTANPVMGMGDPPATPAQRRGAIDQVSMFLALMTPPAGANPCDRTLRVLMDGRARFDLVMRPDGEQAVRSRAWEGSALKCTVAYRPIAGFGDPQEAATLTFLLAPIEGGLYAPVRVEMPSDDLGVVVLDAKRLSVG